MTKAQLKKILEDKGLSTSGLKSDLLIRLEQHLIESYIDPVQCTYSEPEQLMISTQLTTVMAMLNQIKAGQDRISLGQIKLKEEVSLEQVKMESLVNDIKEEFSMEMSQVRGQVSKVQERLKVTDGWANEVEEMLEEEVSKKEELVKKVDEVLQIEMRPVVQQAGVVISMAVDPKIIKKDLPEVHDSLKEC